MELRESISLAAGSLRTNKMRSLLTLLGIIIGIMAVIIIMTLGRGLQNQVMSGLEEIGASKHIALITETPEASESEAGNFSGGFNPPVTNEEDMVSLEQLQEIKDHFGPRVEGVDIDYTLSAEAVRNDATASVDVMPVIADSLKVRNVNVEFGREITQQDIDTQRPVAVVTQELVDAFFDGDAGAAIGERIDVSTDSTAVFTIVGVAEGKQQSAEDIGQQTAYGQMFIPVSVADRLGDKVEYFFSFTVMTKGDEDPAAFRDELQNYLDRWYRHNENAEVEVVDIQAELASFTSIFGIISSVLAAIAGISLLVGGIGVMNIMLITVTERTREIGVRKALGATRRDIRTQFIVEAIMVGLLGGVIGVLLGGTLGVLASGLIGLAGEEGTYGPVAFPPIGAVLFSLLFSMGIGVFFGAYPANKAARMQPIDALRYE